MVYLYFFTTAYIFSGIGFSLASWLQAAELEVNEGRIPSKFFSRALPWFVLGWPVFAVYCYRAEVSRTIEKVDLSKFDNDGGHHD